MPACAVRYRLNAAGPLTYLVEYEGRFFIYTRGALGAALPAARVAELLAGRTGQWVASGGELVIEEVMRAGMLGPPTASTAGLAGDALVPHA